MELFGSTSPSYLILASLDHCNWYLAGDFPARLEKTVAAVCGTRQILRENGWEVEDNEPLKITIRAPKTFPGEAMAQFLRERAIECEFADRDYLVLMVSTETTMAELAALEAALGRNNHGAPAREEIPMAKAVPVLTPRQALFRPRERIATAQALGRIAASPSVGCPPPSPLWSPANALTKMPWTCFSVTASIRYPS